MERNIIIFSDGSSRGNPGPGGWGAIVYMGGKIAELGGRENHTTNNRMELLGAIKALEFARDSKGEITLNTDSSYVISGITKWVYGWQKNGWKNSEKEDVANRDFWEKLIEASAGLKIKWNYVGGHSGIPGNERCDEIATTFADGKPTKLFSGKGTDYKFNLKDTKGSGIKQKSSSKNKGEAYSYLSLVNGKLEKHKTWVECEKRVKGVKGGVKYKKALSAEDEKKIVAEWALK
ncbi:MAG: ribonuclease HI [Candidatus Paceibacterota bacterium]|jgi:ribonuclease HI